MVSGRCSFQLRLRQEVSSLECVARLLSEAHRWNTAYLGDSAFCGWLRAARMSVSETCIGARCKVEIESFHILGTANHTAVLLCRTSSESPRHQRVSPPWIRVELALVPLVRRPGSQHKVAHLHITGAVYQTAKNNLAAALAAAERGGVESECRKNSTERARKEAHHPQQDQPGVQLATVQHEQQAEVDHNLPQVVRARHPLKCPAFKAL